MNKLYIDKWGVVWKRLNEVFVYNDKLGWGGWFHGKGLAPWSKNKEGMV